MILRHILHILKTVLFKLTILRGILMQNIPSSRNGCSMLLFNAYIIKSNAFLISSCTLTMIRNKRKFKVSRSCHLTILPPMNSLTEDIYILDLTFWQKLPCISKYMAIWALSIVLDLLFCPPFHVFSWIPVYISEICSLYKSTKTCVNTLAGLLC